MGDAVIVRGRVVYVHLSAPPQEECAIVQFRGDEDVRVVNITTPAWWLLDKPEALHVVVSDAIRNDPRTSPAPHRARSDRADPARCPVAVRHGCGPGEQFTAGKNDLDLGIVIYEPDPPQEESVWVEAHPGDLAPAIRLARSALIRTIRERRDGSDLIRILVALDGSAKTRAFVDGATEMRDGA